MAEIFGRNFLGEKFFGRIFRRIFLGGFFGRIFLGGFFRRIFWEDFWEDCFWRNYLFYFNVEGIDLFVKILVFVKILSKSKKEGRKNFRSLEVRLQVHCT